MKKILFIAIIICLAVVPVLSGCGESSPVQGFVISDRQLADSGAIENAGQPAEFTTDKELFACVSFIESPKGIQYTVHWIQGGQTIKTEDKEMVTDKKGVINYSLEKEYLSAGTLTVQILYKDEVLAEKEVTVK